MTRVDIIQSLRELADLLESKRDFPVPGMLTEQPRLTEWVWSKEELAVLASHLGSFKKRYTDDKFELVVTLPSGLELVYFCDRDKVCKRVVTYECEDAESILLGILTAPAAPVEKS